MDQWLGKKLRALYRGQIARAADDSEAVRLKSPAVVFAPHPDDETLGCGGTILRKRKADAVVKVVFMTDGRTSHSQFFPTQELVQMREREAVAACLALGLVEADVHFLRFPDNELSSFQPQAVQRVTEILCQYQPAEVFLPFRADPQPDHISTNQIVMSALQRSPFTGDVYEFPIWYWFHWPWISAFRKAGFLKKRLLKNTLKAGFGSKMLQTFGCRVNIQRELADKKAALNQHKSQMTEIIPNAGWPTLASVADGDFLDCFFQSKEIFHKSSHVAAHPVRQAGF
jgi:LmbE family N-acetylglucosaminyl deacetylase